jgi:hypothetical protein
MNAITIAFIVAIGVLAVCGVTALTVYVFITYQERAKHNEKEFFRDLYMLRNKWQKRGELYFSEAVNDVLMAFSADQDNIPQTDYGKNVMRQLLKDLKNNE